MGRRIRVDGVLYEEVKRNLRESVRVPSVVRYISKRGTRNATLMDGGDYGLFLHSYVKRDDFLATFNCTSPNYYDVRVGFGRSADLMSGNLVVSLCHYFFTGTGSEEWRITVNTDVWNWVKDYGDQDSAIDDFDAISGKFAKIDTDGELSYAEISDFGRDEVIPLIRRLGFKRKSS